MSIEKPLIYEKSFILEYNFEREVNNDTF